MCCEICNDDPSTVICYDGALCPACHAHAQQTQATGQCVCLDCVRSHRYHGGTRTCVGGGEDGVLYHDDL